MRTKKILLTFALLLCSMFWLALPQTASAEDGIMRWIYIQKNWLLVAVLMR